MAHAISRRNFIKTTGTAAALGAASMGNVAKAFGEHRDKSRIIIAKDTQCLSGTTPVTAKMQDMVDYSIMALTGLTDKGKAYEALFPAAVTTSTKILLKRNDISGKGAINTAMVNALKSGLTSMLGGAFPAANVTIRLNGASALSQITSSNYLINCPVCWCHGTDYGVTLSLKNTMTYLNSASTYHSANKRWLHEVSLDSRIRPKQILSFMDAVVGNNRNGPGTSSTFTAHTLIVGRDLVAVDYCAMRLMENQPSPSTTRIATGGSQLRAAQAAGLGTCEPNNMEIINIGPPWNTGLIHGSAELMQKLNVRVINNGTRVDFIIPKEIQTGVDIAIFDMAGKGVWAAHDISGNAPVWHCRDLQGNTIGNGMYVYQIKVQKKVLEGVVSIIR